MSGHGAIKSRGTTSGKICDNHGTDAIKCKLTFRELSKEHAHESPMLLPLIVIRGTASGKICDNHGAHAIKCKLTSRELSKGHAHESPSWYLL